MKLDILWKVVPLAIGALLGYFGGQIADAERFARLETRVDALSLRLSEYGDQIQRSHHDIRVDLASLRSEVMAILKESR